MVTKQFFVRVLVMGACLTAVPASVLAGAVYGDEIREPSKFEITFDISHGDGLGGTSTPFLVGTYRNIKGIGDGNPVATTTDPKVDEKISRVSSMKVNGSATFRDTGGLPPTGSAESVAFSGGLKSWTWSNLSDITQRLTYKSALVFNIETSIVAPLDPIYNNVLSDIQFYVRENGGDWLSMLGTDPSGTPGLLYRNGNGTGGSKTVNLTTFWDIPAHKTLALDFEFWVGGKASTSTEELPPLAPFSPTFVARQIPEPGSLGTLCIGAFMLWATRRQDRATVLQSNKARDVA